MRFPTWLRFAQLLERYSQGAFPIGFYYPRAAQGRRAALRPAAAVV